MRVLAMLLLPALLACGGATPAPKDDSEAASSKGAGAEPASSAAPEANDSTPAASASSAAPEANAAEPTPPATTDSGDLKAAGGDDPWLASHQMPPKDVMKTMRRHEGRVRACWKAGLKRDPSTSGEVKIRFVITNDGKVRAWRDDESSMSDADVTKCIGAVLEKARFPKQKSPGDAWGSYSINFSP